MLQDLPPMDVVKPALVVGSYTMGMGVIRSLGRRGVPVVALHYDSSAFAHRSRYVTARHRIAHPEREEAHFIEQLRALAPSYRESVLLPASDAALAAISRHRSSLAEDFVTGCVDWEVARLFIEKKYTYEIASGVSVPIPRTIVPKDEDEVVRYGERAMYPVLVKPSQGHLYTARFGRKMTPVTDGASLLSAYREAESAALEVMLQEIIPGPDSLGMNYNSYALDGEPIIEFTARQIRSSPTGFGSPRVVLSEHIPKVLDLGRRMVRALNLDGFSCIEFKEDPRDGSIKLMEVNGRHNLSSLLAVECGVDFPWVDYDYLANGTVPEPSVAREGVYWIDIYRDLATSLKSGRSEGLTPRGFVEPYRSPHVFAVASLQDPIPFLVRSKDMFTRMRP